MTDKAHSVSGIGVVYHATTVDQLQSLIQNGIDPLYQEVGRRFDFGPGFYTTTQLLQAREFAYTKQAIRYGTIAAILEYNIPEGFWAGLNGMEFEPHGEPIWKKFVMGYRSGAVCTVPDGLDYVYGPVADNLARMKRSGHLPTPIRPAGRDYYDQIAFHSTEVCRRLNSITKKGGGYLWVLSNDTWTRRRLSRR